MEEATGSKVAGPPVLVQGLWSGYGRIERWWLRGEADSSEGGRSVILKVIDPGDRGGNHPRGWDSSLSDSRKRKSYAVERAFYRGHIAKLEGRARSAALIAEIETHTGGMMILEDLDRSGFSARHSEATDAEIRACVRWLATFHAAFMGRGPGDLWERGTYWHLGTRPDELAATKDTKLRNAAPGIDARLGAAKFRTFVHGDAKIANFCFQAATARDANQEVAAVDFQYVGGGVGVQDLSYFLGSCLEDGALAEKADGYLDVYFENLKAALDGDLDGTAIEREWRALWPFAWADFHRFLAGWAPGHWKLSEYSNQMLRAVI